MTRYVVITRNGPVRCEHRIEANGPEHAEFVAMTGHVPQTGLARMVHGISGTRWEVESVEEDEPVATGPTCTVRSAVTGACGRPAVHVFTGSQGETFGECAEHYDPRFHRVPVASGPQVGDTVFVRRHGRVYYATVSRVGARGAVYASVTYGNGATREVRV